jgi:predicted dehydrogenase
MPGGSTKVSNPIRVAVAGLGGMGQGHCRTITGKVPEMRLVAVCDLDAETAAKAGAEFKVPHFASVETLIQSRLCDLVMVAAPHPHHPTMGSACLKAGLHVIVEKPVSENIKTAEALVQQAEKAGLVLGVMFQQRLLPPFRTLLEAARRVPLGPILRATLLSPDFRTQAYYDSGKWRATWAGEGGGVLINQAPHILDVFVQLAGMPVRVQGFTQQQLHDIEVEDVAEAMLTYPGGGRGYIHCSTTEPGPGRMIEIAGELGKLVYRDDTVRQFRYRQPLRKFIRTATDVWARLDCEEVPVEMITEDPGFAGVFRNVAGHLLHGEELRFSARSGLGQIELSNAIVYSAHLGRAVDLPLDRAAYDRFLAERRASSRFSTEHRREQRVTDPHSRA